MLFYRPEHSTNWFRNARKYIDLTVPTPDHNPPKCFISIVTRCMNRLHDVSRTLPVNIKHAEDYQQVEFVLLDYGSTDGVGRWVRDEMMDHIQSGKLVYYRTTEPKYFCPNHSQNVTFRLAEGSLVANVDTDNYIHKGYLERLNQCASVASSRLLIVPDNFLIPGGDRLYLKGRFAMYKKDIEMLRGFDEDLDGGFGYDDMNFVLRAMMAGFKMPRFEKRFTDGRLPTTNEQRVSMVKNKDYKTMLKRNEELMMQKLCRGRLDVNRDRHWGKATLVKNFSQVVRV